MVILYNSSPLQRKIQMEVHNTPILATNMLAYFDHTLNITIHH